MNRIRSGEFAPTAVFKDGKPVEFSYIPLRQYGATALTKEYGSFSELLTDYYGSKRSAFLISDLAEGLFRVITQKQRMLSGITDFTQNTRTPRNRSPD